MNVMEETLPPIVAATQLSREQIMDATARCLRAEGYDATTIRRIAAMLGCAVGSIYRYFQDKRDLLDAVAQASLEPAAALVEAGGSVEDSAMHYHELAGRDPALHRLMYWITAVGPTGATGDGAALAPRQALVPRVVNRIVQGWSRRLGDEALARQCWMTLHGCIALGASAEETLALLRELAQPAHAMRDTLVMAPRPARIAPVPTPMVVTPSTALPSRREAESQAVEDVVLL
jgi:AcrR family transcriptional regulator